MFRFTFKPAEQRQCLLIHAWLAQEHIKAWLHGDGLKNTLEDLENFFKGSSIHQHWIVYETDIPFGYLLTSDAGENAITLDLFICDLNYLGKGLSVQMIHEFLLSRFPHVKKVLIDPEATNTRAVHVYQKAGFRIVGEFIARWHPVLHYQMQLDVEKNLGENLQDIFIRQMKADDLDPLVTNFCFPWTSPEATQELWRRYYEEQQKGIRTVAIVQKENQLVGYGSLLRRSEYPHFSHIPEINAVWINQAHRRTGLGKKLIAHLESLARKEGYKEVGIGVGLYRDYGPAQKLYFQLGYAPDGNGITYKQQAVIPGQTYPIDDDLVLWLIKPL